MGGKVGDLVRQRSAPEVIAPLGAPSSAASFCLEVGQLAEVPCLPPSTHMRHSPLAHSGPRVRAVPIGQSTNLMLHLVVEQVGTSIKLRTEELDTEEFGELCKSLTEVTQPLSAYTI